MYVATRPPAPIFREYGCEPTEAQQQTWRDSIRESFEAMTSADLIHDRPTRSEQSLEGAAVNGLTPVGQEDEL